MKFRHFEFRLFPKLKSRRKKKQKKCNPDFPRDIGLDKNFNYSNPGYYSYYDNLAADDTITGEKQKIYDDVVCDNADACYECSCSYYTNYPLPELTISVEDACDCSCETGISGHVICTGSGERCDVETPDTPSTIPRTRTRIKTNPWLPSPKATPTPSPTETSNSIVCAASELTIPYRYPLSLDDEADDNIPNYGPLRTEFCPDHERLGKKCDVFQSIIKLEKLGDFSIDDTSSNLSHAMCKTEELERAEVRDDACEVSKPVYTLNNFTFAQFLTYDSSAASTPVTEGYRSIGCVADIPDFDYESKTNELLESACIPRDESFETTVSSTMLKETDHDNSSHKPDFVETVSSKGNTSDSLTEDCGTSNDGPTDPEADDLSAGDLLGDGLSAEGLSVEDLSAEEGVLSSTPEWTICESNMQTSTDTGYGSISRDTDSITSTDEILESTENRSEDGLEWDNEPSAHNLLYNIYQEKQQLLMTRSMFTVKEMLSKNKRSRSLADIEMSLDEKVSRLRAEKLFVQLKIREAIEEEIVRRRQLRMFRSVSPDNRKELLVKTLHDLKTRLENQSARLQTSYDTVLSLQRRFSERRNAPKKIIETSI